MSRRYALFDAGNKGASLTVENGGVLLTTLAAGLSFARSCRSTQPQDEDNSDVEIIIGGSASSIASKISLGLCTASALMTGVMGGDGESIAYRPAEGEIHTGGASVASVATSGIGDVIKVTVTFTDTGGTVAFYRYREGDGLELLGTQPLPAGMIGEALYFAASVGSDAAPGDIWIHVQSNALKMQAPQPGFTGWWVAYELAEAVRISTLPYLSHHDDDFPSTRWNDGVRSRGTVVRRGFSCWMFGKDNQVQGAILGLEYTDPTGLLDHLLSPIYRDQPVDMIAVDHKASLATAISRGLWYHHKCEATSDLGKSLQFKDAISLLDLPLQPRDIRPDADPQSANRVMPTLIGVAGSIPVILVDSDAGGSPQRPTFQISGQDVEQIGKVRVAGIPLVGATDYTVRAGAQQIQLHQPPDAGEVTLDASRTGAAYIPPAPVDGLGGTANPFVEGVSPGTFADWDAFDDPTDIPDSTPFWSAGKAAFPQNSNSASTRIEHKTLTLTGGMRYRVSGKVFALQAIDTGLEAEIGLTYLDDRFSKYFSMDSSDFWGGNPAGDPVPFEFTFLCLLTHTPTIYYAGNQVVVGGTTALIGELEFTELPPIDDVGDDIEVEDALPALGLRDSLELIFQTAGMDLSIIDLDTAAAIDAATGFAGGGVYFEGQVQRRDAIEALLAGYTAGLYRKRDGRIGVLRWPIPEETIGSDPIVITGDDLLSDLLPRPDEALGLTNKVGVRRNYRRLTDADLDVAGLSLTQRARLAQAFRYTMSTGASFAPGYDHALGADVLETGLWFPADGQATADYAGRAYGPPRAWYSARMPFRSDIDIGTVVLLKYPLYGLAAGVPAVAVPIEEDEARGVFERIDFWAIAPFTEV